jgi:methylated-DNA-protein-cysteine methyltransferase related protein
VSFEDDVLARVRATTAGEVLTYGEVALEVGRPGAARAVGNVLARSEGVPWWRVVAASGRLLPGREADHGARLRAEGVTVDPVTHRVRGMRRR